MNGDHADPRMSNQLTSDSHAGSYRRTGQPDVRHVTFGCACAALAILFRAPIVTWMLLAWQDDRYTSTLSIPLISVSLIFLKRRSIFTEARYGWAPGIAFSLVGLGLFELPAFGLFLGAEAKLSIQIFSLVVMTVGAFLLCYGAKAGERAFFPLALLVLMVPIPGSILEYAVVGLQKGSSEASYRLFRLLRVPVFREGSFKFSLPGVSIEVAEECSGIRSSLSLFIASLVAGFLLLRSAWSRTLLTVLTIPIVILKNAARIVTISCLGVYVDPGFLQGRLHRYSGLPFSLLGLAVFLPMLVFLIKAERHREVTSVGPARA